jgi:hypothetical protein
MKDLVRIRPLRPYEKIKLRRLKRSLRSAETKTGIDTSTNGGSRKRTSLTQRSSWYIPPRPFGSARTLATSSRLLRVFSPRRLAWGNCTSTMFPCASLPGSATRPKKCTSMRELASAQQRWGWTLKKVCWKKPLCRPNSGICQLAKSRTYSAFTRTAFGGGRPWGRRTSTSWKPFR